MKTLELRTLRPDDEASFKRAVAEFNRAVPPWTFAFDFDETGDFSEYIRRLDGWSLGVGVPETFVPNTYFVGVVDAVIVGRLSLRHNLNEFLQRVGGHIGYGVVPSQRRRGYATEMLRQVIPICAARGIDRAMLTCDEDNIGSRIVIETCGGVFDGMTDASEEAPKRRYWIDTRECKIRSVTAS